jgi:dethiobiotin synthetase
MGMSGSASFQKLRKSRYSLTPVVAAILALDSLTPDATAVLPLDSFTAKESLVAAEGAGGLTSSAIRKPLFDDSVSRFRRLRSVRMSAAC